MPPPPSLCQRCDSALVDRHPIGGAFRCWACGHEWRKPEPTTDASKDDA